MPGIKLVAPFKASGNHHQRLLGLLKQKPAVFTGPLPVLQVPVSSDIDVSDILAQNERKLDESTKNNLSALSESTKDVSKSVETSADDDEADEIPVSFVELGAFQPQNRLEQICTVFFQDFPALKPQHVERVLLLVAATFPAENGANFRFSVIAESINDTRGVFVRFPSVATTQWAKKVAPELLPHITAVFDEKLDSLAASDAPAEAETSLLEDTSKNIASVFSNRKLYSKSSRKSGTEDLDEVMQYYRTYKVENSELVEVPKELKEVIVRDIIKFRAKVLTIEREARKKEIERERRKAKARLTSIFEGIRSTAGSDHIDVDDNEAEKPKDVSENPLDLLSDQEYQAHIEAEQKRVLEEEYQRKYDEMVLLEKTEKNVLLERLEAARGYESALVENKLVHMDEFKIFHEMTNEEISSGSAPAALSDKLKLYYTNHGEYLRVRNQERTKEEQMDDLDRAEEAKLADSKVPSSSEFTPKISIEVVSETKTDPVAKDTSAVIVSALSEANLVAIKEQIGNLVEEFLGIEEDVLADFIYDFVLENNLDRAADLVAELQETLDEDSQTLVDQLHRFVASL